MGLLDTYRINKAIAVLLTSQDAASAETLQAVATLNRLGKSALPKLVEALGKVRNPQTLVALLAPLVQNATLPLFGDGLASSNPRSGCHQCERGAGQFPYLSHVSRASTRALRPI